MGKRFLGGVIQVLAVFAALWGIVGLGIGMVWLLDPNEGVPRGQGLVFLLPGALAMAAAIWGWRYGLELGARGMRESATEYGEGTLAAPFHGLSDGDLAALVAHLEDFPESMLEELQRSTTAGPFARVLRETGLVCEFCDREAPVAPVDLVESKGRLVFSQTRQFQGFACLECAAPLALEFRGATMREGWFGFMAILRALDALNRTSQSLRRLRALPPAGPDSRVPRLDAAVVRRHTGTAAGMIAAMRKGEGVGVVARAAARARGGTPAEAALYLLALAGCAVARRAPQR